MLQPRRPRRHHRLKSKNATIVTYAFRTWFVIFILGVTLTSTTLANEFSLVSGGLNLGGTASSSSPNFRLVGNIGAVVGSSSSDSFGLQAGFLILQTPTPSPTPTSTPTVTPGSSVGGGGFYPVTTVTPIEPEPSPEVGRTGDEGGVGSGALVGITSKNSISTISGDASNIPQSGMQEYDGKKSPNILSGSNVAFLAIGLWILWRITRRRRIFREDTHSSLMKK